MCSDLCFVLGLKAIRARRLNIRTTSPSSPTSAISTPHNHTPTHTRNTRITTHTHTHTQPHIVVHTRCCCPIPRRPRPVPLTGVLLVTSDVVGCGCCRTLVTLIRSYFSPEHSTAQKYIYTGSAGEHFSRLSLSRLSHLLLLRAVQMERCTSMTC